MSADAPTTKRPKRRSAKQQELADRFDDALAEVGTVAGAAKICGISPAAAEARFTRIRKKLGWQAQ